LNAGFLSEIEVRIDRGDEKKVKKEKAIKVMDCAACGLSVNCKTPKFPYTGKGKKKILIVLESPSGAEDEEGEPWVGILGSAVKELIEDNLDIDIHRDCWTTFATRCFANRLDANRVRACSKYLKEDIEELNPLVIIVEGYWGVMGLVGDDLSPRSRQKNIDAYKGYCIPQQSMKKWVIPVDFFGLNLDDPKKRDRVRIKNLLEAFEKALELVKEKVEVPVYEYKGKAKIITNVNKAIMRIMDYHEKANEGELKLAMDYETTGIKPYRTGHRIKCVALSDGKKAWAFPFFEDYAFRIAFKTLIKHKNIRLICHNAKFEYIWTRVILGYWPGELQADTILGCHCYRNNKPVGLKPNVFAFFGIGDYDSSIDRFLEASKKEKENYGDNAFNNIDQAPEKELLLYNAYDALFTFWLSEKLDQELSGHDKVGYKFLMRSSMNLVKAEFNGIRVDRNIFDIKQNDIEKQLVELKMKIQKQIKKIMGRELNILSGQDVAKLFYDTLGFRPEKQTYTGNNSTDADSLNHIEHPLAKQILLYKKLDKLRGTYLEGVKREIVQDNLLHPFFDLYTVTSFRSSSHAPNFQNFPKRDKESYKIIRSLLYPFKGQRLAEADLSGAEVRTSASYNNDRNLIKAVTGGLDMHRWVAAKLYNLKEKDVSKEDRQAGKNSFVFPEFYGSFYKLVTKPLWERKSELAGEALKKIGIKTLSKFEDHVKEVEHEFWYDLFPEYTQWKKDNYNLYSKKGLITSLTGFTYYGPMTRNEVGNLAIQGSAHHILLYLFNGLSDYVIENNLKSKIIGQIHDSIVMSIEPGEENLIIKALAHLLRCVEREWDWLKVPLEMEIEIGEVDRPWNEIGGWYEGKIEKSGLNQNLLKSKEKSIISKERINK